MDAKETRTELPLGKPYIKTYTKNGALTSILNVNPNTKWWMVNQYLVPVYGRYGDDTISMYELKECNEEAVWKKEWEMCPYIESIGFKASLVKENGIVDFLIKEIDAGYYIYFNLDTACISAYNPKKGVHDMLVNGYDIQGMHFFCSDYFGFRYETMEIPFAEINAAYEAKRALGVVADYNYLWRYTDAGEACVMDKQACAKRLSDFVYPLKFQSVDPLTNKSAFLCTGIGMYEYLLKELQNGVISYGDARPFSAIKEHLKVLADFMEIVGVELPGDWFNCLELQKDCF